MPTKGVYTSELYVVVGTIVSLLTAAFNKNLPPTYAGIAVAVLAGAYAAFRSYVKVKSTPSTVVTVAPSTPPTPGA